MGSPEDLGIETDARQASVLGADTTPHRLRYLREAWPRIGPGCLMTPPLAGRSGHGSTVCLRRQPTHL